jgi:soluble lytic murein transglycosylase-like protein
MRFLAALAALLFVAPTARAEIAVFDNGSTMKVVSHRNDGGMVYLALGSAGEIEMAEAAVRGFVPDEVFEEVLQQTPRSIEGPSTLATIAERAARKHGLDPSLVMAVIAVESNFKSTAVSPKGARGLMQLMPRTADAMGVDDSFDPEKNVDGGSRYLSTLLQLYGGDTRRALAAYNAGPGAVARHGGVPPYAETQTYVRKVMKKYEAERSEQK